MTLYEWILTISLGSLIGLVFVLALIRGGQQAVEQMDRKYDSEDKD